MESKGPFGLSLVAVALCLALAPITYAQFETATVLGTVRDVTGSVIPLVRVTLENVNTGITSATTTDETGSCQFLNVRIGTYRVKAEATGFSTAVAEDFSVTVNARQRVDLVLQVGNVTESITVREAAKLLEADSSDRGQIIDRGRIVDLPLNGRSYADLSLLTTGVRKGLREDREASFNVNGLRFQINNFLLDGVDNNSYQTSNEGYSNQVIQVSPDAVEEFKVQTNSYSAEFGRSAGAVINASIRSGTNQFHGSAWEFSRNTVLNAAGFFKPPTGKPALHQNQFGFTFGGPIRRDHTFFFLDYEGFRRVDRGVGFATIPTIDQRQGILGVPIQHPLTGQVFANGVISADSITPFAQKVLGDLPTPNLPGLANNYTAIPRQSTFSDKGDVKIDHHLNSKVNFFVRLSQRKSNINAQTVIPGQTGGGGPGGGGLQGFVRVLNQQLASSVNYVISPSSLLDVRLGVSRSVSGQAPFALGGPNMKQLYGITGLPEGYPSGGLTTQRISGFSELGRFNATPQEQDPTIYNPRVNFSKIAGRHTVKVGYEYQRINTYVDDFNPKYGTDSYSGQFSKPAGGTGSSAVYNLADFLFGARNSYQLASNFQPLYRQRMHFWYVQDDFKFSPKLTLNLGLRYEFATPQYEETNRLSNYDPVTSALVQAKPGSLYNRSLVHPDRNDFAPRVGLAYNVTPKWVVRSGLGVSYVHFNRAGGENILAFNGPNAVNVSITQEPFKGLCSPNSDPLTCFRPTQMGYPENLTVPANYDPAKSKVIYLPADTRTGYVMNWHITIQRELARNLLLDVGYVGNHSVKLLVLADYNQARPNGPGESAPLDVRRRIRGFGLIQIAYPQGFGSYHALQTKLEKRFSRGISVLNSFTWSKAIDLAPGHLEEVGVGIFRAGQSSRINYLNPRSDRGLATVDQPVNNVTSMLWELPFGHGRRFGSTIPKGLDFLVGGWKTSLINTMGSGNTQNLSYSPSALFTLGTVSLRPNLRGDPYTPKAQRTIDNYFNKETVALPTDLSRPFGNAGRNIVRSRPLFQADFGVQKDFGLPMLGEGRKLEFRSEFFNLLNKTNFQGADGNRSNASFGQIRSAYRAREVQLALKLYF